MTRCERFESEAVLLLERGLPLDEHFSTCPDCLAARAAYEELQRGIGSLGQNEEPPVGWQARVWEEIEQRRERRRRWPFWLVPVGAAALAAFFFVRTPEHGPPTLTVGVQAGPTVHRGVDAKPGDRLQLTATAGGAKFAELRVYRNDGELVLNCSTEPPCSRRGDEVHASVVLDGIGRYQPLMLLSRKTLSLPASDLETDTSAALAAGADVQLGSAVVVR